jgi:hypothetical protein
MSPGATGSGLLLALLLASKVVAADQPKPAAGSSAEPRPEGKREPQVRTYTSVTILKDPTQAPPLPKSPPPQTPSPRPVSSGTAAQPAADGRVEGGRERAHIETMRELREELRELRRGIHRDAADQAGGPASRPDGARPAAEPHRPPPGERLRERPFDPAGQRPPHGEHRRSAAQ